MSKRQDYLTYAILLVFVVAASYGVVLMLVDTAKALAVRP